MITNDLPVTMFRDQILSTVARSSVTIITAETGAGKSTQVPQYLMHADYEVIVTQPRRLAARTLAERVAEEYGCQLGEEVGFQTGQERMISDNTQCRFVTDGLQLVHELLGRTNDSENRVLVLDEVHEWNLNVEVLLAWVNKQIKEGALFKVVLMSATLEAEKLSSYFDGAPVISVPGRMFPVEVKDPGLSLLDDVVELARKGRNVLVFQPGKAEIEDTVQRLSEYADMDAEILPLHGELDSSEQQKCFKHYRRPKIVVSTNVAQTSVTIDDIDAVVDSGMERRIELVDGVEGLYLKAISRADSKQRKGRAGRTKPGIYIDHCQLQDRLDFPLAEIERTRLDQTVLRLAEVGFDMEGLQFFHQPDIKAIHGAKESLKKLGCMSTSGKVTSIGRKVARLPVSVAFGRMIVEADRLGVMRDILTIAAILETGELNIRKDKDGLENNDWKPYTQNEKTSDLLAHLNLYKAASRMSRSQMWESGIRAKAFERAREVRRNLETAIRRFVTDTDSVGSREDVLKSICAGMVNHLYRSNYGTYVGDSINREIGRESVVQRGRKLVVGLPFDLEIPTRQGFRTLNLIRMVTIVEPKWLIEVAPHLIEFRTGIEPRYDRIAQMVVSTTETLFNGIEIESEEVPDPHNPLAVEISVDNMYEKAYRPKLPYLDDFNPNVKVPAIVEQEVGVHPTTGEMLMLYGTYRFAQFGDREIWSRTMRQAIDHRNGFIEWLARRHRKNPSWYHSESPTVVGPTSAPATADKLAALAKQFGK